MKQYTREDIARVKTLIFQDGETDFLEGWLDGLAEFLEFQQKTIRRYREQEEAAARRTVRRYRDEVDYVEYPDEDYDR